MDYNKKRFGELVDEAVCQIAIKRGGGTKFAATEAELAAILHISVSTIQKYRQGASMPSNPEQAVEVLVQHCVVNWGFNRQWADSLLTQVHHPNRRDLLSSLFPKVSEQNRVIMSYQGSIDQDQRLATHLYNLLQSQGHNVFPDNGKHTSPKWFEEINERLKSSDLFIVLLSNEATHSEMTLALIQQAYEYRQLQNHPQILPIFVAYEGALPHPLDTFLDEEVYIRWTQPTDDKAVAQQVLVACQGDLPQQKPLSFQSTNEISEDGDFIKTDAVTQPRPQVNPRFLETSAASQLEIPGGAVKLRDRLYIERDADQHLKREVIRPGTTMTIRAPRQTGKSSLLVRGLHHARQHGLRIVNLDMQSVGRQYLSSLDDFLRSLAESIVLRLRLNQTEVDKTWTSSLSPNVKLTYFLEDYVLPQSDAPIVLALDEADRLLRTDFYQDFFSLLRSWHNERAYNDIWDKLNLILVISTEPYLLIPDISQSPFNVGLKLNLDDFNVEQVKTLNQRHNTPISDNDIPQLMQLLNGHPYLTRKAFYVLMTEEAPFGDLMAEAADELGPFGDHLRHHYWLLQDEYELKASLKEVIDRNKCADEDAFFRLLRAGLVKGTSDACRCRCDLYKTYFQGKL